MSIIANPPDADDVILAKTSTYTVLTSDTFLTGSGTFTFTLYTAVGNAGKHITIKNIGSGVITVACDGSETIDGVATYLLRNTNELAEFISNGTNWLIVEDQRSQDVGHVSAFLKSLTNTPSLTSRMVECNGQTLSDAQSVYNGVVIPNLNASGGGTKRFLRGSTTSGSTGGSETHNHTFNLAVTGACGGSCGISLINSTSTLPSYYEVVWTLGIK